MIIISVTIFFIFIYISFFFILSGELNRQSNIDDKNKSALKFSVVVAAKNEERNIPHLIFALSKLNYPKDDFEIIIVDDNSADETFTIAEQLLLTFDNFRIVRAVNKKYEGKRGALDFGISLAKYNNILITDADCKPGKSWLYEFNNKFNSDCNFIIGLAPFTQHQSLINKISCYENFKNSLLTVFACKIGIPFTASARNFGFNKIAFEKIEGYKNTTDTLSGDDDLLLREAVKNKLKISTITSEESFVFSETKQNFEDYFNQRARHTQTSFHYSPKQRLFLFFWHTSSIFFLFSPLLIFLNLLFLLPFAVKLLFDLLISILYQEKLSYKFSTAEIFYLQIFYEIFLVVHLFNSRFRQIKWK